MKSKRSTKWTAAIAMVAVAITMSALNAQPPAGGQGGRGGGGRGGVAPALFTALDTDKDGSLTRSEMKSAFDSWFTQLGCRHKPDL